MAAANHPQIKTLINYKMNYPRVTKFTWASLKFYRVTSSRPGEREAGKDVLLH